MVTEETKKNKDIKFKTTSFEFYIEAAFKLWD